MSNMALLIHAHLLITQLVSELLTHPSVKNKFTSWRTVFVDSSSGFSFRICCQHASPKLQVTRLLLHLWVLPVSPSCPLCVCRNLSLPLFQKDSVVAFRASLNNPGPSLHLRILPSAKTVFPNKVPFAGPGEQSTDASLGVVPSLHQ